jgi:GTPase SAR1 family protein
MATPNLSPYVSVPRLVLNYSTQLKRAITGQGTHRHTFAAISENTWIREIPYLNGLMLVDKKSEQLLFQTYFSKEHLIRAKLVEYLLSDRRITLILGEPGCGKTTILNYLYRYSDEMKEFRSSHEFIILTCNINYASANEDAQETITLYQWITAQFTEELIQLANKNNFAMEDVYANDIDHKGFVKALNEALARMKMEELDEIKKAKVLLGLMKGPTYSKRLLDWFEKRHPDKKISVVIDNLDCYTREQREECFANLLPLLLRQNVRVVIPLRYGTQLDHTDSMHQYGQSPKKIAVDPPVFKQILNLRLTKLPAGVVLKDKLKQSEDTLQNIWSSFSSMDAVTLFNGLFGTDTRQKLEIFKEALTSYHFISPENYQSKETFIRMLMVDEYCLTLPEYSKILNIFDQGSVQGYQNTLVRIRVLQLIRMSGNLCLNEATTIEELSEAYSPGLLLETVNALIKHGMVEIQGLRGMALLPKRQKSGPYIVLTHSGDYYLDHLLRNRTYVTLCAQSSLIPESVFRMVDGISVCARIQQLLLEDEGLNGLTNKLWDQWGDELFVPLNQFINYIESEEKKEGHRFANKEFVSAIALAPVFKSTFLVTEVYEEEC